MGKLEKVIVENGITYVLGVDDIDEECHEMLDRIVEKMKEKQGVTKKLKAENQMMWVWKMNNIIACAEEVVVREVVYV